MRCAIGFVAHTGWAAAVAMGAEPATLLDRRRVELIAGGFDVAGVYHAGQKIPLAAAERKLKAAREEAERNAKQVLSAMVLALHEAGHTTVGCAIVGAPKTLPADLAAILKSHALIHTAEGELYRAVLARAADASRLPARRVPTKELDSGSKMLVALGRDAGAPWGKDQKLAALAALRLLAGEPDPNRDRQA